MLTEMLSLQILSLQKRDLKVSVQTKQDFVRQIISIERVLDEFLFLGSEKKQCLKLFVCQFLRGIREGSHDISCQRC